MTWASAYWEAVQDDARSDRPVTLTCDDCGAPFQVHPDDVDDETRLCVRCALAVAAARYVPPDERYVPPDAA